MKPNCIVSVMQLKIYICDCTHRCWKNINPKHLQYIGVYIGCVKRLAKSSGVKTYDMYVLVAKSTWNNGLCSVFQSFLNGNCDGKTIYLVCILQFFLAWLHVTYRHLKPQWCDFNHGSSMNQTGTNFHLIGGHWTMKLWKHVLHKIYLTLSDFIPHGIDLNRLNDLNECFTGSHGLRNQENDEQDNGERFVEKEN